MIVATLFALGTLGYVAVDVIIEAKNNVIMEESTTPAPVVVVPIVEELRPEVMPEIVEQINADEADAMISDSLAMKSANYE